MRSDGVWQSRFSRFGAIEFYCAPYYPAGVSSVGIELHATTVNREPLRISDHDVALRARYVLGRPLAQGGMAALYLGQRIVSASGNSSDGANPADGFSKQVVLKRLRPELSQNRDALTLFSREAELAASLDHPAIVRAFDLTAIDGVLYLVMEYVRGGDLRLVLRRARRRNQRFSAAAGLYIGRELCAALEYTHTRGAGLIHRDISPTNILLSADGEIKLTDFGIAQAEPKNDEPPSPRARGHVGYMSPELARGEALDARSDLFSLAAVLYEVFTDRRLFVGLVGQPAAEVYGQDAPAPPSQLCAELPSALDAVLLRALALPAAERPKTAAVLYQQLVDIARQSGLFMDRAEFAAHLQKLCGADPAEWASLEERTATALIASISAEHEIAEHDEPLPGIVGVIEQASAMHTTLPSPVPARTNAAADVSEPSEPAITVPWPTVAVERAGFLDGVPIVESDDTQPFPSGPVSIAESLVAESLAARRLAASQADDDDAVTGPAPRTTPPEKLLTPVEPLSPPLLLNATTAPHLALPISMSILETRPAARIFSGDRLVGFAYGLTAGLVAGIVVALLAWTLLQGGR